MGTVTEATETPYGADLSGGFVWYEKGMEWAVEKGTTAAIPKLYESSAGYDSQALL